MFDDTYVCPEHGLCLTLKGNGAFKSYIRLSMHLFYRMMIVPVDLFFDIVRNDTEKLCN